MLRRHFAVILLGLLFLAPQAHAYNWTVNFKNLVATEEVALFLTDDGPGDVDFDGWVSPPSRDGVTDPMWGMYYPPIAWTIDKENKVKLEASGAMFGATGDYRGLFEIQLTNDLATTSYFAFDLMFYDDQAGVYHSDTATWTPTTGDEGILAWANGGIATATTPTPIGGTAWLLASGLLAVVGVRRGGRGV